MPDESEAQEAEFAARYLDERYGTRRVSVPLLPTHSSSYYISMRRPGRLPVASPNIYSWRWRSSSP